MKRSTYNNQPEVRAGVQNAKENALVFVSPCPAYDTDLERDTDAYALRSHGQVRALRIPGHRMQLTGNLDQIVELPNRVDVGVGEGLDGEVARNGHDDDRVEVVREEPGPS